MTHMSSYFFHSYFFLYTKNAPVLENKKLDAKDSMVQLIKLVLQSCQMIKGHM